ncbi:MAG TPA: hypothetical protein VFS69_05335 [Sphingomicrobium sp.]|nr:hypothetical protein [Sphingomicrobium sp.]
MRTRLAILLAGSMALGGCAYGYGGYGSPYSGVSVGVGYGSGYGYPGYGYGGYGSYGNYGYGGCYDPYSGAGGYGGYDPYGFPYGGYGYGSCGGSYWGWNNGYYYPGTGYYVYDSYRRPHVWSDSQKRYWSERVEKARRTEGTSNRRLRENWSGFNRQRGERTTTADRTITRQQVQRSRAQSSEDRRAQRAERRSSRSDDRDGRPRRSDDTRPE